ncbi:hypothetical protein AGR8A_pAt30070 [Agrobacterium fabrum str. J-07]|nr:hypothetical protein AGR8A_pAt30070 [Agrobacterium fabrum str. J-07]
MIELPLATDGDTSDPDPRSFAGGNRLKELILRELHLELSTRFEYQDNASPITTNGAKRKTAVAWKLTKELGCRSMYREQSLLRECASFIRWLIGGLKKVRSSSQQMQR